MARFNTRPSGLIVPSPIVSAPSPTARTGNNAPGFVRDAKSELFLLGVGNFVGTDTFHEKGKVRDQRFVDLIRKVAVQDSDWTMRFFPWLRNEANMRTASLIGVVEASKAMVEAKIPGSRKMVYFMLTRADEPGEMIAYLYNTYGRKMPKPIKRGIADAIQGFYTEWTALKWDTASHGVRFGDVLELVHAKPRDAKQAVLFKWLIDRRHNRDGVPSSLRMIHKNRWLREQVAQGRVELLLDSENLKAAGMTWEDALSLAGNKVPKKELWEALIPTMGSMALLRNLRNFDEAGVSDDVAQQVIAKLTDSGEVARSRQLPMRFLSAFNAVSNLRWAYPLEQALNLSLQNIPEFMGSTLILIDTSGSMNSVFSKDGTLRCWDAAAMFGLALAQRCENATVVSFSDRNAVVPMMKGASLLAQLDAFKRTYFFNGGTATHAAITQHYRNHDRVVVLTDEQANYHNSYNVFSVVPANRMCLTFNLAGYRVGHAESGSAYRVTIGGLTDQAFKLMPILEQRAAGQWPF